MFNQPTRPHCIGLWQWWGQCQLSADIKQLASGLRVVRTRAGRHGAAVHKVLGAHVGDLGRGGEVDAGLGALLGRLKEDVGERQDRGHDPAGGVLQHVPEGGRGGGGRGAQIWTDEAKGGMKAAYATLFF